MTYTEHRFLPESGSVALYGETLERKSPSRALRLRRLRGEREGTTNEMRLHGAPKPVSSRSNAKDDRHCLRYRWGRTASHPLFFLFFTLINEVSKSPVINHLAPMSNVRPLHYALRSVTPKSRMVHLRRPTLLRESSICVMCTVRLICCPSAIVTSTSPHHRNLKCHSKIKQPQMSDQTQPNVRTMET